LRTPALGVKSLILVSQLTSQSNTKTLKNCIFAVVLFFNSMLLPHLCPSCKLYIPLSLWTQGLV